MIGVDLLGHGRRGQATRSRGLRPSGGQRGAGPPRRRAGRRHRLLPRRHPPPPRRRRGPEPLSPPGGGRRRCQRVPGGDTKDAEKVARAIETGDGEEGDSAAAQAFTVFARAPGNDPAALVACLRRPTAPLQPADLAALDRPVLVVLGDRDFAGPADPLVEALPERPARQPARGRSLWHAQGLPFHQRHPGVPPGLTCRGRGWTSCYRQPAHGPRRTINCSMEARPDPAQEASRCPGPDGQSGRPQSRLNPGGGPESPYRLTRSYSAPVSCGSRRSSRDLSPFYG